MRSSTAIRPAIALAAAAAVALLSGGSCRSNPNGAGGAQAVIDAPLTSTEWECTAIVGHAMPQGTRPTLTISLPDRANGNAGVNRYFGTVDFDRESMRFSKLGSTRMAGPPERMELEHAFLAALERCRSFRVRGNELTMLDDGGAVIAAFAPDAAAAAVSPASR
jgi:heat shock protein HslJ